MKSDDIRHAVNVLINALQDANADGKEPMKIVITTEGKVELTNLVGTAILATNPFKVGEKLVEIETKALKNI